jgi:hypothetical protein
MQRSYIHDIGRNKKSTYAKHFPGTHHENGKTEDNMDILKITPKGRDTNTWDHFVIYIFSKEGLGVNEQRISQNNGFGTRTKEASIGEGYRMLQTGCELRSKWQ